MIIGSKKDKLEDIVRDMKKHTSSELKVAIKNNIQESRKEWMLWMMERAGKKTAITKIGNFGNSIINRLRLKTRKCLMKIR